MRPADFFLYHRRNMDLLSPWCSFSKDVALSFNPYTISGIYCTRFFFGHLTQVQATSTQPTCIEPHSNQRCPQQADWRIVVLSSVCRNGITREYPEMSEWLIKVGHRWAVYLCWSRDFLVQFFSSHPERLGVSPNMTPALSISAGSIWEAVELKIRLI